MRNGTTESPRQKAQEQVTTDVEVFIKDLADKVSAGRVKARRGC